MLDIIITFCFTTMWKIWIWIIDLLHLRTIILFLIKKSLWYGFFFIMAFSIILRAYFQYVPEMDQKVKIEFHLINGKYYGFIFDQTFKQICDIQQSDIIPIHFSTSELKFQRSFLCGVVIHEENNEVVFQDEYYEIKFNIDANYLIPNQKTIVEMTSYLISEDQNKNFKQQNLIKLGEYYNFSFFRFLPFRIIIKLYNKLAEFLDLNDSYQKRGEITLFSNIPNTRYKAIILEMIAYEAAQFESEIIFIPVLTGMRYYLYYYFYTTFIYGTFALTIFFIFCWEVIFNVNLWVFILGVIRAILVALKE